MMNSYKRFRYPKQIIGHAIWVYHRFSLSFRDIEEILACRGIVVSYESIRQWCLKFTASYAKLLRKKHGALGDEWFLDEVFIKINGKQHYLWRAVCATRLTQMVMNWISLLPKNAIRNLQSGFSRNCSKNQLDSQIRS